jgi:preprotein translocase subunit SecF
MNKPLIFSILLLTFNFSLIAQDYNSGESPVEEELTNLIEKSNDYQGFKVVDYNELITLKKNTSEFISKLNNEITTQKNTIDQHQQEISELKSELETTRQNLEKVTAEKDAISFLGIPFSKSGYMSLMWGIIIVLIIALLFFIFRFKKGHAQTSEARQNLSATEKEFEVYRAKALEKEQRLGRLLQDERNKASDK